jgi:O-acetyl-ADP-ribose deacetylase (regulator of RNase III)
VLLASCYQSVLSIAVEHGVRSIAFPAISCGVFGYPPERAADIAVREIRAALAGNLEVSTVILVAFDERVYQACVRAVGDPGTPQPNSA